MARSLPVFKTKPGLARLRMDKMLFDAETIWQNANKDVKRMETLLRKRYGGVTLAPRSMQDKYAALCDVRERADAIAWALEDVRP